VLRISGFLPLSGSGPRLVVTPSPAHTTVEFDVTGLAVPGRLEILDPAGRLVWSEALDPGDVSRVWNGQRSGHGEVRPGSYFARLLAGGTRVSKRFVWLGK